MSSLRQLLRDNSYRPILVKKGDDGKLLRVLGFGPPPKFQAVCFEEGVEDSSLQLISASQKTWTLILKL